MCEQIPVSNEASKGGDPLIWHNEEPSALCGETFSKQWVWPDRAAAISWRQP